jgi:hypothetical protein
VQMHRLTMSESRGFWPSPGGGGWLVDDTLFRLLVDFEIQKAQRLRYSIAVVCVTVDGAPAGNREASAAASVAESLARQLRSTDAVASWAQGWFYLLLVDAEPVHLSPIVGRLTTRLEMVGWSAGGACYPGNAIRADDMLRQSVDLMVRARAAGVNKLYVES